MYILRNIENNPNVEPCQEESHLDGGISLSNDNDVIPSNNDLRDTATEKRRATPEVGMTFDSFEAVDEFYSAFEEERIESPVGTSRRRKKSKKCGCGAGMAAFINKDGLWQIHKVELTHTNHAPSPSKSRYVPTFRDVPKFVIWIVKDLIDAGVKQSQIYHALANQLNGFENIPFLLKDMHNAVQKDRCKEFDEQDCHSMFQYFAKMKEANEDFFYSWTVDEANKLKDLVWVDARSRATYRDFGDVDSETYKWVMRQWLECMGDVQPGRIITDQSTPMANAIQEVLPNSRHRLCVWNILSKVPRKVLAMKNVEEFQKNMKDVVYDSLTPEEFEGRWISLIQSFKLEGNEWLNGLWEDRRRWVPAYVKDVFWEGMSTTQQVESIHHFFKGFMNAKTTLRNFVQKYTRALDHRANAEKVATANDDRCKARVNETHLTEHVTEYTIEDRIQVGDPVHHVSKELKVVLDREKGELRCTCRLFEHRGILCRHCIRVMEMTNMPSVPEKHVLQWRRKDNKRKHLDIKVGFNDPDKTAEEICSQASVDDATQANLEDGPMVGEGVQNPPIGKRIGCPPVKTPYGYPKQNKTKGSSNSKESTKGSVNMPPQNPKGSQGSSTPLMVCNDIHHNDYLVPFPFHNEQLHLQSNSASVPHEYSHGHFSEIYPSWEMGLHNGTQGSISNLLARGLKGNAFPSGASFPTIGAPFFTQQMLSSASSYNMSSGARPPIRPSTSSSLPSRPH
ncbi:Protein FAR-RED IMPAIRED RESPONSE 1 [Bienertia sinuspersici]